MFLTHPVTISEMWTIPSIPYSSRKTSAELGFSLLTTQITSSPCIGKPLFFAIISELLGLSQNTGDAACRLHELLAAYKACYYCRGLAVSDLLVLAFPALNFQEPAGLHGI